MGTALELGSTIDHLLRDLRTQALCLSLRARDHFTLRQQPQPREIGPIASLAHRREMLIVTARLAQVVLWVLDRSPSISPDDDADFPDMIDWRADPLLLDNDMTGLPALTPEFDSLRQDSLALYHRVVRIEAQTTLH
jgi:hypothetical protein